LVGHTYFLHSFRAISSQEDIQKRFAEVRTYRVWLWRRACLDHITFPIPITSPNHSSDQATLLTVKPYRKFNGEESFVTFPDDPAAEASKL